MATCIHSSRSCLLPFYTIPIFPLLNRKIFHLLVILIMYYEMEMKVHCNSVTIEVLEYMPVNIMKMLVFLAQVV